MAVDGLLGCTSQRKRQRPLPASDSSKSTTTNSAPHRGGTCPKSASLSSSATTNSISGNQKRIRVDDISYGASIDGDAIVVEYLKSDDRKTGRAAAAGQGGSVASTDEFPVGKAQISTRPGGKTRLRCQTVRQVEKLISTMFKELDVLLRAESVNRRVMVRIVFILRAVKVSQIDQVIVSSKSVHLFLFLVLSLCPSTGGAALNEAAGPCCEKEK